MEGRKAPPSHCLFTIKSFSLLSQASVEKYTLEEFEAGEYRWALSIYPTGNKERDAHDHVSIYLNLMTENSSLFPVGCEVVNAIVNFFTYDFLHDEYFCTQDASIRRFHKLETEWGIPKFIDLASFNDPSKGYLKDDTCVFGAEIFIVKPNFKGGILSMIDKPPSISYTWKFDNFSKATDENYKSKPIHSENYKWNLIFYPKGSNISVYLSIDKSSIQPDTTKLYVYFILRVRDQITEHHVEEKFYSHFSITNPIWGSNALVPLATLKDPTKGFLKEDSCILETEFKVLGLIESP